MILIRLYIRGLLAVMLALTLCIVGMFGLSRVLPAGDQIVYMANRHFQYDIFLRDLRIGTTIRLTWDEGTFNKRYPEWSPDGRTIIYHANPLGLYEFYTLGLHDDEPQYLAFNDATDELLYKNKAMVNWSPDGEWLAFHAGTTENSYDVYLSDISGQTLIRLTASDGVYLHPYWSPDGTRMALTRYDDLVPGVSARDTAVVYIIDLAEAMESPRNRDEMIRVGQGIFPAWSPDGRYIAYVSSRRGSDNIHLYDVETGEDRLLTGDMMPFVNSTHPDWTPDSQRIIFTSDRDGSGDIYIMRRDGSGVRRLTVTPYHSEAAAWRPNR